MIPESNEPTVNELVNGQINRALALLDEGESANPDQASAKAALASTRLEAARLIAQLTSGPTVR